jgi:hypothetical protein
VEESLEAPMLDSLTAAKTLEIADVPDNPASIYAVLLVADSKRAHA